MIIHLDPIVITLICFIGILLPNLV